MNRKIIFAHIPKTAGTSFRTAMEETTYETVKDYGERNPETSKEIKEIYINNSLDKLKKLFEKKESFFLSSHFHDTKIGLAGYCKAIPSASLVTFLRDPVERVISEYWHFIDLIGYQGSFSELIQKPEFKNRQSKSIDEIPIEKFHFVGTTETYQDSLTAFNEIFETELKHKVSNKKISETPKLTGISKEDISSFCHQNIQDITLYNKAITQSYRILRKQNPTNPLARYAGSIGQNDNGSISGWAIDYFSSHPTTVTLKTKNGSYRVWACEKRNDLKDLNIHISGYAGFTVNLHDVRRNIGGGEIEVLANDIIKIGTIKE